MTEVSVQSPATLTATAPVRVLFSATGLANVRYKDEIQLNDFEFIVGEDQYRYALGSSHISFPVTLLLFKRLTT
jgi:hypothetical protein